MIIIPAPNPRSLKRCWPWQFRPAMVRNLVSIAHHEAGHIVALEWVGLGPTLSAWATSKQGAAYHGIKPGTYADGPPDESGEITAAGASMFHAGLMAELLLAGLAWTGPIYYPRESDYQRANDMLREAFGHCSSAGHAYAQRTALHIVSSRWPRVMEIARDLIECGEWPRPLPDKQHRPTSQTLPNQ